MKLGLSQFNKQELKRACELMGCSNKNNSLEDFTIPALKNKILTKVNKDSNDLREQYLKTLKLFKIKHSEDISDEDLRKELYEYNSRKIAEAIDKMSKKKKKKLAEQIEKSIDPDLITTLKQKGKWGPVAGGGILLLQAGAVSITGANLGICMLMTTGLSAISSILGVTFPFAAYTTAAIAGGYLIQAGHFLASPFTAIPMLGLTTYLIFNHSSGISISRISSRLSMPLK